MEVHVHITVEPPLTGILYSGHLIIQDKMSRMDFFCILGQLFCGVVWKWTKFVWACQARLKFALRVQLSKMQIPHYFVKWTDFAVLPVPGLYKIHSIMQTLASLSHKIVLYHWLIHQLDIIPALVHIVLTSGYSFWPSYSKGELWNMPL